MTTKNKNVWVQHEEIFTNKMGKKVLNDLIKFEDLGVKLVVEIMKYQDVYVGGYLHRIMITLNNNENMHLHLKLEKFNAKFLIKQFKIDLKKEFAKL